MVPAMISTPIRYGALQELLWLPARTRAWSCRGAYKDLVPPPVVPFVVDMHLDVRGGLLPTDLEVVPTYQSVPTGLP
jgi:hypothetical protein